MANCTRGHETRCRNAKSPPSECECACGGRNHAADNPSVRVENKRFDTRILIAFECDECGNRLAEKTNNPAAIEDLPCPKCGATALQRVSSP